ncbi:MAG: TonB-dependent receptor [Bacteroidales bacterium]
MNRVSILAITGLLLSQITLAGATTSPATLQPLDSDSIPSEYLQLEEVVVMSTRATARTPVAYSEISKKSLTEKAFGQDMPYLLQSTPSLVSTSDAGTGIGYSGFRIRGTDANRINITLNGVPLNDAESHGVFWVNMPDLSASLGSVQVQRGVGGSSHGAAAFGATVNMQNEPTGTIPYAGAEFSAGSFGTLKSSLKLGTGTLGKGFSFDGRLSSVESDGYVDRASVNLHSWYLNGTYKQNHTLVKLVALSGREKTYQAWNGVSSALLSTHRTFNPCGLYIDNEGNENYYNNQTDNYRQTHYQLLLSQELASGWNSNATLHYTAGQGYYEEYKPAADFSKYRLQPFTDGSGSLVESSDLVRQKWLDNDFFGMIYSLNHTSAQGTRFTVGASANRYLGHHFGKVIWAKEVVGLASNHEYYRSRGEKEEAAAFSKVDMALFGGLSGYVDLQYRWISHRMKGIDDDLRDITQRHIFGFFNPKAGLMWKGEGGHSAFVSWGIAQREPNRNNYTDALPNEKPTHETLYDYEAGYRFLGNGISVSLNLFYMYYKDQLILNGRINEIGEPLTTNIPKSFRTGMEWVADYRISSWLTWQGQLTLSLNRIENFTEYVDNYDTEQQDAHELGETTIAFSPGVVGSTSLRATRKQFSAEWRFSHVGRQYLDNTRSADRSLKAYSLHELWVGYTFHPKWIKALECGVRISNLLNHKYENKGWVYSYIYEGQRQKDDGYFAQAGRHFMGRVALSF